MLANIRCASARFSAVLLIAAAACWFSACAFDIVSVKQNATTYMPQRAESLDFVLQQEVTVAIGTGFPTHLKKNTRWHAVGVVNEGVVFATADQVVTVEASNIHEAQIVVSNGRLIGFYLPVERTFTPAGAPIPLDTKPETAHP